jgi:hypothetical protein
MTMETPYGVWADALAKFHSASDPIQALGILAFAATVLGMTWCVMRLIRDITVAALNRSGRRNLPPAYHAVRDSQGRWLLHQHLPDRGHR